MSDIGVYKKYEKNSMRVIKANRKLAKRGLIDLDEYKDKMDVTFVGASLGGG